MAARYAGVRAWSHGSVRVEDIAASMYPLFPGLGAGSIGLEQMCRLRDAVRAAGGGPPVVIDSDDLVARPGPVMAPYCAAVGVRRDLVYQDTVANSAKLARIAARHRPFYEQLLAERLRPG